MSDDRILRWIELQGIGPWSPEKVTHVDLAPRLNIFTGDNGLGKSFILDTAWELLTGRRWQGARAIPLGVERAEIAAGYDDDFEYPNDEKSWRHEHPGKPAARVVYDSRNQQWKGSVCGSFWPVVYARADGGVSIWSPRLSGIAKGVGSVDQGILNLTTNQIMEGLDGDPRFLGLIQDWVDWKDRKPEIFQMLTTVLEHLSEGEGGSTLTPGESIRVSVHDSRRYPTLLDGNRIIPSTEWSSGVRRIVSLAYALVWNWEESVVFAEVNHSPQPLRGIVLIVDEVETHLHPRWQRRILPALLGTAILLADRHEDGIQLLVTTHSPLVLASMEKQFDRIDDRLFSLDRGDDGAELSVLPWRKRGDANAWLTSEVFGPPSARSVEAEKTFEEGKVALHKPGGRS